MSNVQVLFYIVIFACLSFVYAKNALHMFQQARYELRRYNKWLFNKNNLHFSNVFIYLLFELVLFLLNKFNIIKSNAVCIIINLLVSIGFAIYAIRKEENKVYVKELVLTNRVKRQIVAYSILIVLSIYLLTKLNNIYLLGILSIYMPYVLIYPMAIITLPIEEGIKKHYENEARNKLDSLDSLIKVGITGSFGKTSTKNIVNDIISDHFFTLITPASYNTPMGITRTVRGDLKPIHDVFVCEMGADKVNDIAYLMDFVKPKYGIVTSIGPQHLATFKSMENIINEKMQEIEMLPSDGVGFINLDNKYIRDYYIENDCKIVSVGIVNENATYVAKNIKYSNSGTSFTVNINGKNHKFNTCLLGQHNITNILLGIALAIELGVDIKDLKNSVEHINQVEHRLEVKKINDYTFIDDAFNSNPVGSKMALDVLSTMSGKRVIVTPGMIDLGKIQDKENYEFGKYMLNRADVVLLVGEKQTKPIYKGLKDVGFDMENVLVFTNVKQAFNYIYSKCSKTDTILLENDLPDAFNV